MDKISSVEFLSSMSDGSLCTYAKQAGVIGEINKYDKLDEMRGYVLDYLQRVPDDQYSKAPERIITALAFYAQSENKRYADIIRNAINNNSVFVDYGTHFDREKALEEIKSQCPDSKTLAGVFVHEVVPNKNYLENTGFIDGRYSSFVKAWALDTIKETKDFPFENYRYKSIADSSHAVIVNSLAETYIKDTKEKESRKKTDIERD